MCLTNTRTPFEAFHQSFQDLDRGTANPRCRPGSSSVGECELACRGEVAPPAGLPIRDHGRQKFQPLVSCRCRPAAGIVECVAKSFPQAEPAVPCGLVSSQPRWFPILPEFPQRLRNFYQKLFWRLQGGPPFDTTAEMELRPLSPNGSPRSSIDAKRRTRPACAQQ